MINKFKEIDKTPISIHPKYIPYGVFGVKEY
jgi:hypothetical protein